MKVRLSASGFELTSELERYANVKIAHVTKKVPRKLRAAATCEVQFAQTRKKGAKVKACTISLCVDGTELRAEETTLHMYAALDIAAVHIEQQLADHIAQQHSNRLRTRLKCYFRSDWTR